MFEAVRRRQIGSTLRLFVANVFGGTIIEQLAAKHDANAPQFIPFALCGFGWLALAAVWRFPRRVAERVLQGTMAVIAAGGLLGVYFRLRSNLEFVRETQPAAGVSGLISGMLSGRNPVGASTMLMRDAALALFAASATGARARDQALVPVPAGTRSRPAALAGRR